MTLDKKLAGQAPAWVDPHARRSTGLLTALRSFVSNRGLIARLARREIGGRYRESVLGLAWTYFNPLMMLVIYTFVFSEIFKARWSVDDTGGKAQFALILFVGMIVLGFFNEVMTRAPLLIVSQVNFVKKVVFPLEVLPLIATATAAFHAACSIAILLGACLVLNGFVHWTAVFLPVIFAPLMILGVGVGWILSSIGVFLRDLAQLTSILAAMLTFLSPVFYPISAVPPLFRSVMMMNPLTFIIEQARGVIIWGHLPHWPGLLVYYVVAVLFAWIGFAWFQRSRQGFADVL